MKELAMKSGPNATMLERREKTIYAVDDSPEMQTILQMAVKGAGYDLVSANGGAECLSNLKLRRADAFLVDFQMPGMDGLTLCREIRNLEGYKDTPIIFLTVRNTHSDIKTCLEAGGNDYIVKPVNAKTLIQRVDHWVLKRDGKEDAAHARSA